MPLPTITKTWNWTSNQRSTFTSVAQSTKDILYGFKVGIAAMSGASIKGSSVGATSSMDAVDRWTSAGALGGRVGNTTTNGTTWVVITLANMGGIDVCLAFIDPGGSNFQVRIAFSAGGTYTVSNTQHPVVSNSDEVVFAGQTTGGAALHSSTASGDRIWSIGVASDGTAIHMLTARAGVTLFYCTIQLVTSTVVSPATFSPAVVIVSQTVGGALGNTASSFLGMNSNGSWWGAARATKNGSTFQLLNLFGGCEGYGNTSSANQRLTFAPELQGGGNLLQSLSVWSETGTTRGKLGYLVDTWFGFVSAADGDTFPNNTTRTFIQWGTLALPWDGSVVVLT